MPGHGLLSERAARTRVLAELAWQEFTSRSDSSMKPTVWEADWSGSLACVLAAYTARDISSAACQDLLALVINHGGSFECRCSISAAARASQAELHLWHASWQRAGRAAASVLMPVC